MKTFWISLNGPLMNPELIDKNGECQIIERDNIVVAPEHFYGQPNFTDGNYWAKDSCLGAFTSKEEIQKFVTNHYSEEAERIKKEITELQNKLKLFQNITFKG